jgi:hypothetical protein
MSVDYSQHMANVRRARMGPKNPAFQDVASGVTRSVIPQVWVSPTMRRRLEIAVAQRAEGYPKYGMADYVREAVRLLLDHDLGPETPAKP